MASPADNAEQTLPVVELFGFLTANLGLGQAARGYARALQEAGVPLATRSVLPSSHRQSGGERRFEELTLPSGVTPDVNLLCANADQLHDLMRQAGGLGLGSRYSIGHWAWETDVVPGHWRAPLDVIDELWVNSAYVAQNLSRWSPVPVVVVPLPVERPSSTEATSPSLEFPVADFTFLSAIDFLSTVQRKNPLGVIEAFKLAFSPGEGPALMLKTRNAERRPADWNRLRSAARDHPDITVADANINAAQMSALLARANCFVSLHRSEGFGLMLAESMALGKPVIATGFGGNTDFMTPWNSYLVDWSPTRVGSEAELYPAEGSWAEPSLEHAASLLREVWENQEEAARRGARAAKDVAAQLSAEAVGGIARARLVQIGARSGGDVERHLRFDLSGREGRGGSLRRMLRRIVMLAIRPYTWAERHLDEAIVAGLRRLEGRVSSHDARLAKAEQRIASQGAGLAEAKELREPVDGLLGAARAVPWTADDPFEEFTEPKAGRVLGFRKRPIDTDEAHRSFEDTFRESAESVEGRLRPYVPLLRGHEPVLDVGCGRGELLAVLGEAGVEARGVDLDAGMVGIARDRGLDAEVADGIEAIEELEPGSLGAITAIRVVEHLPFEGLQRLLRGALAALRPGGLLIFETINPHTAPALKTLWVDPTHRQPIFPEVALALAGIAGFEAAYVWHPRGARDFRADRSTQDAYALVARAPASAGETAGDAMPQ